MIRLRLVKRTHPLLLSRMAGHYSRPRGFVGRNICYIVSYDDVDYGAIVGGSTPLHLPNRPYNFDLNSIVNNLFYNVRGPYPVRNFTSKVVREFRHRVYDDWFFKYGDFVEAYETLVELPRRGELYLRDGWREAGTTKGFTCKRVAGVGSDGWSGKRVWDVKNLRPKRFLYRLVEP